MLIRAERSILIVVDIQERLVPATAEPDQTVANCARLMHGAARLGVPMLLAELYSKGLGRTLADIRALAPADAVVEKLHFSCVAEAAWRDRLAASGRDLAVICGMEAHVCVLQTALDLAERGHAVAVVADAVASRSAANKAAALARMARAGVEVATTEMVLFEWLHRAGTPEFKDVLELIK